MAMVLNNQGVGVFYSPGNISHYWKIFLVVTAVGGERLGATGTWWVETRGAARHSQMHRTGPTTERYLAPNVNCAEVEKP